MQFCITHTCTNDISKLEPGRLIQYHGVLLSYRSQFDGPSVIDNQSPAALRERKYTHFLCRWDSIIYQLIKIEKENKKADKNDIGDG